MADQLKFQKTVGVNGYFLRSISLALKKNILLTATFALLLVCLIQTYCTDLAVALNGTTNSYYPRMAGFVIPFLSPSVNAPFYSNLVLILGWVLDLIVLLLAGTGIAQIVKVRLLTGKGLSAGDILTAIRQHRFTVLFSATGLWIIAVFFSILMVLLWLTRAIPGVGLILFILLSPLTLAFGLFLVGTLLVVGFSLPSLPGITILWQGDAFSIIAQAYTLVLGHPGKLLRAITLNLLEALLAITAGGLVLGMLLLGVYLFLSRDWLLGIRFAIAAQAGFVSVFPINTSLSFEPTQSARIIALVLKLLSLIVLAYGWATLVTGQMLSFVRLKQETNEIDLLEQ